MAAMPFVAPQSLSPKAGAATPAPFGVSSLATLIGGPPTAYRDDAVAIRNIGATWIRVVIPWNKLEWVRGQYDWTASDRAIDAAAANGLNILVLIEGPAPPWAQAPGTDITANGNPPADPATFGTVSRVIAERYKDRVDTWEIWNEPNVPEYFVPVDTKRYATLLRQAYMNIHAVQPDANVLSGGVSSALNGIESADFVQQLYDQGADAFFDAVAVHPYTFPYGITEDPAGRGAAVLNIHNIMSARGQSDKKIWITEFGQATGTAPVAVSPKRQAEILVDFLNWTSALPYLGPSFLFTTRDLSDDPAHLDFNFGLYTMDYRPKPVVDAVKALSQ